MGAVALVFLTLPGSSQQPPLASEPAVTQVVTNSPGSNGLSGPDSNTAETGKTGGRVSEGIVDLSRSRVLKMLDKEITIYLDNVPLDTVLMNLSTNTGLNIVADKSLPALTNRLSLKLDKVKLVEFFRYVARTYDLQFQVGDELVWVVDGKNPKRMGKAPAPRADLPSGKRKLYTRIFNVDTNALLKGMEAALGPEATSSPDAINRTLFNYLGRSGADLSGLTRHIYNDSGVVVILGTRDTANSLHRVLADLGVLKEDVPELFIPDENEAPAAGSTSNAPANPASVSPHY